MGTKGDKHSSQTQLAMELFSERLSEISGITSKKMFGGYGIFHEGKMFGSVNSKGKVCLKADETIRHKFNKAGAHSHGKMPYFSLPEFVFTNPGKLLTRVRESIGVSK